MDVTEQDRALARLEESERRFKATFEQAAVGLAHMGLDGRWLRTNMRLCNILGYSAEELMGRTLQDVTHPDDLAAMSDLAEKMVAGILTTYAMEKRYRRKSGDYIWCNLTLSLMRKPDGTPEYFIGVIEDITWRHRVEAERDPLLSVSTRRARRRRRWCSGARRSWRPRAARWWWPSAWPPRGSWRPAWATRSTTPWRTCWPTSPSRWRSWGSSKTPVPEVDVPEVQRALVQAQLGAERIRDIVRDLRIFSRSDPEAIGPVDVQAAVEFAIGMTAHQLRQRARLIRWYQPVPFVHGQRVTPGPGLPQPAAQRGAGHSGGRQR